MTAQATHTADSAPTAHRIPLSLLANTGAATMTDARGRRVVVFLRQRMIFVKRPRGMSPELWSEVGGLHMTRGWRLLMMLMMLSFILMPLAMVASTAILITANGSPTWIFRLFIVWSLVMAAPLMWHTMPTRFYRRVCGGMLKLRRCPSCVGSLGDAPEEADGCTVCLHCGAAWRLAWANRMPISFLPANVATPIHTGDDRGRMVEVFRPRLLSADGPADEVIPKQEYAAIQKQTSKGLHGHTTSRRGATLLVCLCVFMIAMGLMTSGVRGVNPVFLFLLPGAAIVALRRWRGIGDDPRVVVDVMKRHRRCASCAHTLESLPVQEDDCTVCPECGAAWRLETDGADRAPAASEAR